MRRKLPDYVEKWRVLIGDYASRSDGRPHGAFVLPLKSGGVMKIIACDGRPADAREWEHVSVSIELSRRELEDGKIEVQGRTPTWEEMSLVKNWFWEEEECVVQFHPPQSNYVDYNPFVLHLWRHRRRIFPRPPAVLVGPLASPAVIPPKERATS
jgi:hypothetical protein